MTPLVIASVVVIIIGAGLYAVNLQRVRQDKRPIPALAILFALIFAVISTQTFSRSYDTHVSCGSPHVDVPSAIIPTFSIHEMMSYIDSGDPPF